MQRAHDDLGVTQVRAHAILHDDNHVVTRADDGSLVFDFSEVDRLYDQILAIGIRPVVELSFMPAAIARDPEETVFGYRGIISPPRDWGEWRDVVAALAAHLVDRYGLDEVATVAVRGLERAEPRGLLERYAGRLSAPVRRGRRAPSRASATGLLVGGPSTARREWVEALAAHAEKESVPFDFATSHTYGNLPLDVRPCARPARVRRHPRLVDRVGRRLDALRRDPRRRERCAVRAQRVRRRAGPDGRPCLLGDQRPLRGARPPAAPCSTTASGC